MKSIKGALGRSLKTEEEALQARFDRAESVFEEKHPARPAAPDRVIRDSFTLPSIDYQLIAALRTRCLNSAISATKSEVIRAGLHALERMQDEELLKVIENLPKVKTGRPSNIV